MHGCIKSEGGEAAGPVWLWLVILTLLHGDTFFERLTELAESLVTSEAMVREHKKELAMVCA